MRREFSPALTREEVAGRAAPVMRGVLWAQDHPVRAGAAALAAAVLVACAVSAAAPGEAHAIAWFVPIIVGAIGAGVAGLAATAVAGSVEEALRGLINSILSVNQTLIGSIAGADGLVDNFSNLISEAYPVIQTVHASAVMPLAYVVLAIFFCAALVRLLEEIGAAETGVDLWRIIWVFILFAFAKIVIDNSWGLALAAYSIVTQFTEQIVQASTAAGDFNNTALLLLMVIFALLSMVFTMAVVAASHFTLIVRAIQLYVYTAFAPIPLATFVSPSARPIATGFVKSYVALLLTGAILALLICLFSVMGGQLVIEAQPDSPEGVITWCVNIFVNLIVYVAFAWAMFRSGAWARELVGLFG